MEKLRGRYFFVLALSIIFVSTNYAFAQSTSNNIGTLNLEHNIFYQGDSDLIKIFGDVNEYQKGKKLVVIITSPDGTIGGSQVFPTEAGYYETYHSISSDAELGHYKISATYAADAIGDISFEIQSKAAKAEKEAAEKAEKEAREADERAKEAAERAAIEVTKPKPVVDTPAVDIPDDNAFTVLAKYAFILEDNNGYLAHDKKQYSKKQHGDSITINVGFFITDRQAGHLDSQCHTSTAIYQGTNCQPILPNRVVIERIEPISEKDARHARYIQQSSIVWDRQFNPDRSDLERIPHVTGQAKVVLKDPLPGTYFVYADSYRGERTGGKDLSCYSYKILSTEEHFKLPDCWQDPKKNRIPMNNAREIQFEIVYDKDFKAKPMLSFVDRNKDPLHYVDRYILESDYKKWFDSNYPNYTIYEAIGISQYEYLTLENHVNLFSSLGLAPDREILDSVKDDDGDSDNTFGADFSEFTLENDYSEINEIINNNDLLKWISENQNTTEWGVIAVSVLGSMIGTAVVAIVIPIRIKLKRQKLNSNLPLSLPGKILLVVGGVVFVLGQILFPFPYGMLSWIPIVIAGVVIILVDDKRKSIPSQSTIQEESTPMQIVKQEPATQTLLLTCRKCSSPIQENEKFCGKCGNSTVPKPTIKSKPACQSCGTPLKPNEKFCGKCGGKINQF